MHKVSDLKNMKNDMKNNPHNVELIFLIQMLIQIYLGY